MKLQRARGITKSGKPIFSEDYEHIRVADWLNAHKIFFIHTPNEGRRSWATGKKLKRMGMTKGVADFIIFDPPPLILARVGVVLELKALDGAKPSVEQMAWLRAMELRGWSTFWARGAESAIEFLGNYCGYGQKRVPRMRGDEP